MEAPRLIRETHYEIAKQLDVLIFKTTHRKTEVLCSAASIGAAEVVEKVTIPRVGLAARRGTPPTRLRTNEVEEPS